MSISKEGVPNDATILDTFSLANGDHGFNLFTIYDGTGANPASMQAGFVGGQHVLKLLMPDGNSGLSATGTGFTNSTSVGTVKLQANVGDGSHINSLTIDGTNAATLNCGLSFSGSTSGSAKIQVAAVAGTPNPINLPTTNGTAGQFLTSNGSNPQQASWSSVIPFVAAPGTATSAGTTGQVAFDATHIYVCIATNVWVRATLATF